MTPEALIEAQIELQAMNVPVEGPEDTGVAYSLFVNDPDGHLLELTTYHPVPNTVDATLRQGCSRWKESLAR